MAKGMVVSFDDERGFGFIRSGAYPQDVFVHASAVVGGVRLRPGQRVRFEAGPSENGLRATRVEPGRRGLAPGTLVLIGFGLALSITASTIHGLGLHWSITWIASASLIAFATYGWDKRRAGRGARRIPELALLSLALIGGSPGAALAMALFRHKTRKSRFLLGFAMVVAVQLLALAALAWWAWG